MQVEIKKTLISDDGKRFSKGSDIAFDYEGNHYIANIMEICENSLAINNIECNKEQIRGKEMLVYFDKMSNCNHVYYD
jgi:hypothetical protein